MGLTLTHRSPGPPYRVHGTLPSPAAVTVSGQGRRQQAESVSDAA
jgi:hypothetical protein